MEYGPGLVQCIKKSVSDWVVIQILVEISAVFLREGDFTGVFPWKWGRFALYHWSCVLNIKRKFSLSKSYHNESTFYLLTFNASYVVIDCFGITDIGL